MRMMPLLMLIDSSKRKGNAKRGSKKYFGRKEKEKTGNVQLGYIDDIQVMGVFIAC